MTTHIPQKVPEHFSRVDIGAYMRELRLHYNLSEQDVSERLHIRVKYVAAIENAQFDLMPGKAYARGYVHTYAEFLGLDADQIVERCFGGEMAREVQAHSIPESSNWYKRNKRYGGILAVLLLLGGLFYFATDEGEPATESQTAEVTTDVASVPEEYLADMRNRLMPTAGNYDCLGHETQLGCYFAQRLTRWTTTAPAPAMAPASADAYQAEEKPAPKPSPKPVPKKAPLVYRPPSPASVPFKTGPSEPARLPDPNLAIPEEQVQKLPAAESSPEPANAGEDGE